MNEVDTKELISVDKNVVLLLGEITGRLLIMNKISFENTQDIHGEIHNLLNFINERIGSIYYEVKK